MLDLKPDGFAVGVWQLMEEPIRWVAVRQIQFDHILNEPELPSVHRERLRLAAATLDDAMTALLNVRLQALPEPPQEGPK